MTGERRQTANVIVGSTTMGETVKIPKGEHIQLAQEPRDPRRVIVWYKMQLVEISRGAWDACTPHQR